MQNRILTGWTTLALICATVVAADAQTYPWRSNVQGTSNGVPARLIPGARTASRGSNRALVSFRQEPGADVGSTLSDQQPSVSDVQVQDRVPPAPGAIRPPAAAGADSVIQDFSQPGGQGVASPEPGLLVNSNAQPPMDDMGSGLMGRCNLGCERKLFGRNCRGLEIGGWLNAGYHSDDNGLFNDRDDSVNLHQFWFYVDQQADRSSMNWSLGYRTDLVYGIDGQNLQAFGNAPTGAPSGWDNGWDYGGDYGWAMPQAYLQLANCKWDTKIGKFLSPFGYEQLGSRDNFFYSHSFTRIYTDPYTMTGVLGERKVSGNRSVLLGATTGWDTGFEDNGGGNLILGARLNPSERMQVAFTVSAGDTGYRDTGVLTSGVTQIQLNQGLRYVLQTDTLDLGDNQEFGVVQYLIRDINPCLGLGARLEWWKSDRFFGGDTSSTYNFTSGLNYRFNANFKIRPEVRVDWGALAVDPGQAILGVDAVLTF